MDSFLHKSKDDEKHSRPQGMEEADTAGKKEHEHGKEMSEQQHSSQVHTHDQSNKHRHGHGHGHWEEQHVGGRERADPVEYLAMSGMTPGAFLEIKYRAATGSYDKVERLISSEQMAKQQSEEEAEAGSEEENQDVIYEF